MSTGNNGQSFEWGVLVSRLVHPMKVAIIEAMDWIEVPMSAKDLDLVLDEEFGLSLISYHMRVLADVGAIEMVEQQQIRGALKTFYRLPEGEPAEPNLSC